MVSYSELNVVGIVFSLECMPLRYFCLMCYFLLYVIVVFVNYVEKIDEITVFLHIWLSFYKP
jgi:hypothetical protein